LIVLVVLATVVFIPATSSAQNAWNYPYNNPWQSYSDKEPIWNPYPDGTPLTFRTNPNNNRFSVFMMNYRSPGGGQNIDIVLDHATGLVWQRLPMDGTFTWAEAQRACYFFKLSGGYYMGWRLPLVEELLSLVDPYRGEQSRWPVSIGSTLPLGHPFSIPNGSKFWSATTDPADAAYALFVNFSEANPLDSWPKKGSEPLNVICVRGGAVSLPPPGC